ncbi:MAG TPA: transglycosylase SLT domain-containing protein [Rhodospirillaceae bacterium]|nr:transglycosylase SLT domain-containing protein [Rhodospirillaceae bacterium]
MKTYIFLLLSSVLAVTASAGMAAASDGDTDCLTFIRQAEGYYRIPHGLLEAIALTESGQSGRPYPWSLNIAGQPVFAPSYEAAARRLRAADGSPRRDVAVGCMQIHMRFHLTQFGDPEWALLPRYNVWYAARYLDTLYRSFGNWETAVAHYNASDPPAQRRYLCQVASHLRVTAPESPLNACPAAPSATLRRRETMAARRIGSLIVIGER